MTNEGRKRGFSTRAIHASLKAPSIASRSINVPIYQTASFDFEKNDDIAEALHDPANSFMYSRLSNPTIDALERTVADLEGAEAGVGFASGMAAVHTTAITFAQAGDHVVVPSSMYGGTFALFKNLLPRLGIEATFVKNGDLGALERALRPSTKIVYAETIGNPALFVSDVARLAEIAHRSGARLVIDSTFASPYICRPLEHGADVVLHSASKYLGGHGDLIAGVVLTRKEDADRIRHTMIDAGGNMSPFVAWLILRGLKTLAVRMERHVSSASRIARRLAEHPRIERAIYPGLASHPDHAVAKRILQHGFGGMVAFELKGDRSDGARFMDRLSLIKRAGSLGDVHSLALQPATTTHRQLDRAQLEAAGISEGFIRLSVGLEDEEDLIEDIDRALDA
jgi:methionine-gamma-lyase